MDELCGVARGETMKAGSLFSGTGAFDLGLEQAGIDVAWQCEIDPSCQLVLRHHFPEKPLHEDVRFVDPALTGHVDVLFGGFPCQDLTLAGNRRGLDGERSSLFYSMADAIDRYRPRWFLIENVPGLLSASSGEALSAVVGTLAELGYGVTWRVLDSHAFGVPQRRRRVFIVGHRESLARAVRALLVPGSNRAHPDERLKVFRIDRSSTAQGNGDHPFALRLRHGKLGGGKGPLVTEGYAPTLLKSRELMVGSPNGGIRYLTVEEKELLQGLPEGWTDVKGVTDSKREWMSGGCVPVSVAKWLGEQIVRVDAEPECPVCGADEFLYHHDDCNLELS